MKLIKESTIGEFKLTTYEVAPTQSCLDLGWEKINVQVTEWFEDDTHQTVKCRTKKFMYVAGDQEYYGQSHTYRTTTENFNK